VFAESAEKNFILLAPLRLLLCVFPPGHRP
jgi:hypothetical protein